MGLSCMIGKHHWYGYKCVDCGKTQNRKIVLSSLKRGAKSGDFHAIEMALTATDINSRCFDGTTALIISAAFGQTMIVKRLLEMGADVNAVDFGGRTALMHAAVNNHADVVSALLAFGARLDTADAQGMTAIVHAAFHSSATVTQVLIEHGADVNSMDSQARRR